MATSRRVGNYATSANAVMRSSDQIFDAAMSGKPDFTAISKEAIKGRGLERRAVIEAEGNVAKAGLEAFTKAKRTQNAADTAKEINDIKRPARRMAGVVAGLGAISGAALMHKNLKEDRAERAELRALDQQNFDTKMGLIESEQADTREMIERMKSLTNTSVPSTNTPPKTNESGTDTSVSSSTQVKPASSTPAPKLQAKASASPSPGFKGFVDMATAAGAKYPQLVAAQWALESGWGKSPSGTNNYFGIKATAGESSTSKQTWEVYGGKEVTTSANFKNYDTPQGSVNDLVNKWHKDYKSYKGVNNASDAFAAADMLRQQGYATDPAYSQKLKKIMRDQGY